MSEFREGTRAQAREWSRDVVRERAQPQSVETSDAVFTTMGHVLHDHLEGIRSI